LDTLKNNARHQQSYSLPAQLPLSQSSLGFWASIENMTSSLVEEILNSPLNLEIFACCGVELQRRT